MKKHLAKLALYVGIVAGLIGIVSCGDSSTEPGTGDQDSTTNLTGKQVKLLKYRFRKSNVWHKDTVVIGSRASGFVAANYPNQTDSDSVDVSEVDSMRIVSFINSHEMDVVAYWSNYAPEVHHVDTLHFTDNPQNPDDIEEYIKLCEIQIVK